ncbi:hypothetical protein HY970_00550 [Candidatus Kaiserbacteria bacterium]|nr:hypothetical protein [Candidatus Kaiserbacteria bacterium]
MKIRPPSPINIFKYGLAAFVTQIAASDFHLPDYVMIKLWALKVTLRCTYGSVWHYAELVAYIAPGTVTFVTCAILLDRIVGLLENKWAARKTASARPFYALDDFAGEAFT